MPDRRDDLRDRLQNSDRRDNIGDRGNDLRNRVDDRWVDRGRNEWNNWNNNRYVHHHHWHHGNWGGNYWRPGRWYRNWWNTYPVLTAFGLTSWAVNRMGCAFGWYRYRNPFVVSGGTTVIDNRVFNYSQPIVVSSQPALSAPGEEEATAFPPGVSPEAMSQFDTARQQFFAEDFSGALVSVDAALQQMPSDAVLHEFRALTLFALGQYQDAAATLYAVLSAGPGWDWTTMIGLYPNVEVYTRQLRALEAFRDAHPDDPAPRLLLAYHYLTAGHVDAAVGQLKRLLPLLPDDPLVLELLEELDPSAVPERAFEPPPAPPAGTTIDPATLVGRWQSAREDGESFTMELKEDGEFAWSFTQGGQTQTVTGVYDIDADAVLAMEIEDGGVMLAQLLPQGDKLEFTMLGDDRGTPPLQFLRSR